jgi:hypothetical protein
MHDWEACGKLLEAENETLRERLRDLEKEIGLAAEPPPMFGLTRSETVMFGVLLNNRRCQTSTFMTALFSLDIDDPPDEKSSTSLSAKCERNSSRLGSRSKRTLVSATKCPRPAKPVRAS